MPDESILRAPAREVVPTGKMPSRRPDRIFNVMARPRPEKKREPGAATDPKILRMELRQLGDTKLGRRQAHQREARARRGGQALIRLGRRAALLVALFLLTSTATASAE